MDGDCNRTDDSTLGAASGKAIRNVARQCERLLFNRWFFNRHVKAVPSALLIPPTDGHGDRVAKRGALALAATSSQCVRD
jgi:hypothetical protein